MQNVSACSSACRGKMYRDFGVRSVWNLTFKLSLKWGTVAFATEALSSTLRRYKMRTRAKTHEGKNKNKDL